ncbi:hypothetical protein HBI56_108050 [Parastagonospora nodorum]|nr:hypothetical protein HBH56_040650 [Parastagonospora nodorum]KAH3933146.1 hypothetical protein HBH54_068400 [Parastagonospora nodorum]KAH3943514.1 hypothetical protein HBH53_172570 [Parastagonospora nodorum]KAH3961756.1 hypothetical protein HBH52_227760 [Parastagonospora nodorum]KAH3980994.1 hypothetical protein HBH51_046400 [Parastagonospora nodorum]
MLLANPPKNGTSYLSNIPASTYAFQLNHAIPPTSPTNSTQLIQLLQLKITCMTNTKLNSKLLCHANTPPHGGSIRYANMAS